MQYGTKGERVGELAFESAAEATAAERDSRTLDYLITVIGFGLCRAWIVFCLGAPLVAGAASSFTWAYLLFGALSALAVSFVVNRSGKREGTVRVALFRFTPVALAASGIIIPLALWMGSEPLMVVGFVVGGLGAELRNCPAVGTDHEIGGYLAARHLLSLGHRRIACVVGPHATQMDSEARYHGYCRAMEEAGIPVDERLVCAGEYTQEGGAAAVEKLISQDFTAIFACNDASAYGVCRKLKEYRKKVPEDVSVVGYDDVFYARMLEVPLTTVRQQVREMGREAVRLLLKQIREHKRPESKVIFAPELVVRESTARIQPSR